MQCLLSSFSSPTPSASASTSCPQKCWAGDMNKRPDFSELRKEIAKLLEDQHGFVFSPFQPFLLFNIFPFSTFFPFLCNPVAMKEPHSTFLTGTLTCRTSQKTNTIQWTRTLTRRRNSRILWSSGIKVWERTANTVIMILLRIKWMSEPVSPWIWDQPLCKYFSRMTSIAKPTLVLLNCWGMSFWQLYYLLLK